jgi:hypothetical protein
LIGSSRGNEICNSVLRTAFKFIAATKLDGVVLSAAWQQEDVEPLERTIDVLNMQTPRVVLVGSGIRFQANVLALIFQSKRITRDGVESFVDEHISPGEYTLNATLQKRYGSKAAAYLDVQSLMCEDHCRLFTPTGKMLYIDYGHMTLAGSRYLAPKIASKYGNVFLSATTR